MNGGWGDMGIMLTARKHLLLASSLAFLVEVCLHNCESYVLEWLKKQQHIFENLLLPTATADQISTQNQLAFYPLNLLLKKANFIAR